MLAVAKLLPASSRADGDKFWVTQTRDVHTKTAAVYGVITVADPHDVTAQLVGGRLLQRIHLTATARGTALHHMNQITERIDRERVTSAQLTFAPRFAALLPTGVQPLATFRVGYPVREGPTQPAATAYGRCAMSTVSRRRRHGSTLAIVGGFLGVAAGVVQATVGADIPDWTGAKATPGALGLLTVVLSAAAGAGAVTLRRPQIRGGDQLIPIAAIVVPAFICFTTVGRLWLVPGPLLLAGATIGAESWREIGRAAHHNWLRILLAALGVCQFVMAAGAAPFPMFVGAVAGTALIVAAAIARQQRLISVGLVAFGTVSFAVVAWYALVPELVLIVGAALAVALLRQPTAAAHVSERGFG